jgi:L-threonylcarbamoyladenylate synthase
MFFYFFTHLNLIMRISISKASALLASGKVIAIPTETVYGLAASLQHSAAIEDIFKLKGRPMNNPLIVHVPDSSWIDKYAKSIPESLNFLADAFWPGPLTIVLPVYEDKIPAVVRAGLTTAAFRVPKHPLALQLLKKTGPLVAPSANLSGKPSPTRADHVENDFGKDFPVLDGGFCVQGLESTVVIYCEEQWQIIRLGMLPPEAFQVVLGYAPKIIEHDPEQPVCPGQLYKHYSPDALLIRGDQFPLDGIQTVLGFQERSYPTHCRVIHLGSVKAPQGVAESLYETLRKLDADGVQKVWVDMDFPDNGIWKTIRERLHKASFREK